MSLTSDGERIVKWAKENWSEKREKEVFTEIDVECESYWESRKLKNTYAYEYDFDNPKEIFEQLEIFWKDKEYMKEAIVICVVSMMKGKTESENTDIKNNSIGNKEMTIPQYVYVF